MVKIKLFNRIEEIYLDEKFFWLLLQRSLAKGVP
jgi:hypothetical protein